MAKKLGADIGNELGVVVCQLKEYRHFKTQVNAIKILDRKLPKITIGGL